MAQTVAAPLERRLGEIPGVIELTSRSLARFQPHLDPVRPQPQHRRRRARRAGRAQCRASRPAGRPAVAAVVPQVQSGGDADHDPGADLEDRCRRARSTTPPIPWSRSACRRSTALPKSASMAPSSRRSGCGSIRRARLDGAFAWRTCALAIANANAAGPARRLRRRRARDHHRHQRPAARRARNTIRWWCAPPTAQWCGSPPSPRSSQACATAAPLGWYNRQPSVLLVITKAGDANVIETVDRIRELLPELKRWIPADVDISVLSDRTGTIRASIARHAAHAAGDHRAGDAGGIRVPAARRRRPSRPASPCRWRSPAPAR